MKRLLCLALILSSCATLPSPPVEKPAEKPSYPVSGWQYSDLAMNAVRTYGKELLAAEPSDLKLYCPNYKTVDRAAVYNLLLSAMSKFESGWSATQTYTENFDVDGNKCKTSGKPCVISTGLLQVSIASCRAYGSSAKTTEELKIPEKNLECAVRVLNRQVPRDSLVSGGSKGAWRGGARYWSVLREHVPEIRKLVGDKCI